MSKTVRKQSPPRGLKAKRSDALIQRSIRAYELSLDGLSVRAIGDELGLKSTKTTWDSINRGREYVLEHGIDIDIRKIEIDQLFKRTLGALAEEIQLQRKEGRVTLIERNDGTSEIRRTKGIDPRTAEALARSADRWAQFLGLMDLRPTVEVNTASCFDNSLWSSLLGASAPMADAAVVEALPEAVDCAHTVDIQPSENLANDRVPAPITGTQTSIPGLES
jgi:hypothetical protein